MRPYIILNGMHSSMVSGLLISELPPITKPLMRSNIIEVDGKDGDIINTLGYSAYDKELSIGLYGEYDIDRVIEYFNSSGEVVFSNEPDRIYSYTILDEINYEKLLRFKTATVTFHVQPFKRSAIERAQTYNTQILKLGSGTQTINGHTLTWNGSNITISGTSASDSHFFIPIALKAITGSYEFASTSSRTGGGCEFRVCKVSPIDMQSLGGQAFAEGASAVVNAVGGDYKYFYVYVPAGAQSATISLALKSHQVVVENRGNIYSRPLIDMYGSGQCTLAINGSEILSINITAGNIVIDGEGMNAYKGDVLKNRDVLGNYADVVLESGHNVISWSGNVNKVVVDNYSRWI